MIQGLDVPIMVVPFSTKTAMDMIHGYVPKLNIDDKNRVTKAIEQYEPYINFDELLRRASN